MAATYDAIVLGVGGFGSAALMHLAQRGLRVLGLDQFGVPHDRGSSHGESRIIRKAYFEHPDYVPLLKRTYALWDELEQQQQARLYHQVGLFLSGPPPGEVIRGARQAAREHGVRLDDVSTDEACRRFPQFQFRDEDAVVFEPQAGYLAVEAAVTQHWHAARDAGAELRIETVTGWRAGATSVRVRTDQDEYDTAALVVTAGAWSSQVLDELGLPLTVLRKVQLWYETSTPAWQGSPVFFFEQPEGCFYGVPAIVPPDTANDAMALKIAEHTGGEVVTDPMHLDRSLRSDDTAATDGFIARTLRLAARGPVRHAVCMYSMTPDGHFIVDRHPDQANVYIAAGFSGHGFKFTPVIGEALANLVVQGHTPHPIEFLRLDRPSLLCCGE